MHIIKNLEGLYEKLKGVLETPFENNEARHEAVKNVIAGAVVPADESVSSAPKNTAENTGGSTEKHKEGEQENTPATSFEGEKQEAGASEEKEAAAAA